MLPINLFCLVILRLDKISTFYILRITHKQWNSDYLWRILFFKYFKHQLGNWEIACKLLNTIGDFYYTRCYNCGIIRYRHHARPMHCPMCNECLDVRCTDLDKSH